MVRSNRQIAKKAGEPFGLKQIASPLRRLGLGPVVDQPTSGDEGAVDIVEIIPFAGGIYVAVVEIAGVIGVLPLFPPVLVEKFLRHIPLFDRRIEGAKQDAGTRWFKGEFVPPTHPFYSLGIDILGLGRRVKCQHRQKCKTNYSCGSDAAYFSSETMTDCHKDPALFFQLK